MAAELDISLTTVNRLVKEDLLVPRYTRYTPALTENNMIVRSVYAENELERKADSWYFKDQFDTIHLDEKWFFVCKESMRVYLTKDEVANRFVGKRTTS